MAAIVNPNIPGVEPSVLLEDAPVIEINLHLDKAFIFFVFPSAGRNGSDIFNISVEITEYSSPSFDEETIVNTENITFSPGIISGYPENYTNSDLPRHHVYNTIGSNWYRYKINYVYKMATSEEGEQIFYSKPGYTYIDNTVPSIYPPRISKFCIGRTRRAFQKRGMITMHFSQEIDQDFKEFDIFNSGSSNMEVLKKGDVVEHNEYTLATKSTLELFLSIGRDAGFLPALEMYFRGNIPETGTFLLQTVINQEILNIVFTGSMQEMERILNG